MVGNRECNTERGFKNQLYIELGTALYTRGKLAEKGILPQISFYFIVVQGWQVSSGEPGEPSRDFSKEINDDDGPPFLVHN